VGPHDPAAPGHAEGGGSHRRLPPVADLQFEQLAQEPLVRRREQQRVPERGKSVRLAQEHEGLSRRLAQVQPGVEHDPGRRDAGGLGPMGALD
jgi:hypothetical protein